MNDATLIPNTLGQRPERIVMFGWFGKKPVGRSSAQSGVSAGNDARANQPRHSARPNQSPIVEGPRIEGTVDPEILKRAAGAVQSQQASHKIKRLVDDPKGAQAMAGTLRKWMNDGRS
jgi:hypothetical protein